MWKGDMQGWHEMVHAEKGSAGCRVAVGVVSWLGSWVHCPDDEWVAKHYHKGHVLPRKPHCSWWQVCTAAACPHISTHCLDSARAPYSRPE